MPRVDEDWSLGLQYQPMYGNVLDERDSQLWQYDNSSESSGCFEGIYIPFFEYPEDLGTSQETYDVFTSGAIDAAYCQFSPATDTSVSSFDGRPQTDNAIFSPSSSTTLQTVKKRKTTTVCKSRRTQKACARTKAREPRFLTKLDRADEASRPWPRHILVCAKSLPNEVATEHVYYMIVLHSADVQQCGTEIRRKLGIAPVGYTSMTWVHKASCSQGVIDDRYLSCVPEMKDFFVDVVAAGNDGYVELTLEK